MQDDDRRLALFEAWYEREMPRLFNYISYRVADPAAARDLTAEVCERALARLDQYDPSRGVLDAWMFGIARNAIRNHYRGLGRQPDQASLEALPDVRAEGDSPEERLEAAEAFRAVIARLETLPEQEQEVIALRFGGDLSNRQIAAVMGLSANHVGVLLHRALAHLRQTVSVEQEV